LDRGVINPHSGHILCDAYPAATGFSRNLRETDAIANTTASKVKQIPIALITGPLLHPDLGRA
jgi:hypothetical protein